MTVKSLFEIAVPVRDNDGKTVPEGRHISFENYIMRDAGGYTELPAVNGAWRDESGHVYFDRMKSYRVATDAETARHLVEIALRIYADQKAIFLSEIGRAWVIPRHLAPGQLDRVTRTLGALAGNF